MLARLAAAVICLTLSSSAIAQIVIDHKAVAEVADMPQEKLDIVASKLNFFFAHASVGENMLSGVAALNRSNPERYKLVRVREDATPPAEARKGVIYDFPRGNPGWMQKVDGFKTCIDNGWADRVDVVMSKFCYIDPAATVKYYAQNNDKNSALSQLQAAHPQARFVYMTIPLTTDTKVNIQRNEFNAALREWVRQNRLVLFDIADIQAHDLEGNLVSFTANGKTYEQLFRGYATPDGGHLNAQGSERIALGFYALGAKIIEYTGTVKVLSRGGEVNQ